MTNAQVKARKLELKKQYFSIRGVDHIDRIEKSILLRIRRHYEELMNRVFDPELSKKIDCLTYLIEG